MAERQLVEIARALSRNARILILDEPTATLGEREIQRVFAGVRELASAGSSVIFVSHRLGEVLDLCSRVTVLRDGRMIASEPAAEMDRQSIVELMLGKVAERSKVERRGAAAREGLVVIDQLSVPGHVTDFGLRASGGEIVAIAGQVGSGASEVLRALAGLIPDARGQVSIAGRAMRLGAPQRSIEAGAVFASNDRKSEGLFLRQSVARNLLATRLKTVSQGGVVNRGRSSALAQRLAGLIGFDRKRLAAAAETLSGGNQQKVFLGRCLEKEGVDPAHVRRADPRGRRRRAGRYSQPHPPRGIDGRLRHLRIDRTRRDRGPGRHGGHDVRRPDHADRPPRGHDGRGYSRRDDSRRSQEGGRVTGVNSTTARSRWLVRHGRIAHFHLATLAVYAFVAVLAALIVFGAFATPGFLSISNLSAILTSTAFVGIIAVGSTLIMLSGSLFSISLGTTTAITAILFMFLLHYGVVAAILGTLLAGTAIFAIQGALVGLIGANPIIVTIGAGAIQEGIIGWLSPGDITPPPGANIEFLARTIFGLPFSVYVFLGLALVLDLCMRHTRFGLELYLLGENQPAARAAGLPVALLTTAAFAVAGFCVAVTGVLVAGFAQNVNLQVAGTYTFDAIAAILVGGSAVTGGWGSVGRTVIGALIIATVTDMLLLVGASTGMQILVKGLIVTVVVVLLHISRRERRSP